MQTRWITDRQYVAAAIQQYQTGSAYPDGDLQVDSGAQVSRADGNTDEGVYVSAWVWVRDSTIPRRAKKG
jgi:hypothetical protein